MEIENIYEAFRKVGLTTSQAAFSRDWLTKSESYFSYIVSTGKEPSTDAMQNFSINIRLQRRKLGSYWFLLPTSREIARLLDDAASTLDAASIRRTLDAIIKREIKDEVS